jgi:hypothetical protein
MQSSLLSVGQLCDAGCIALFEKVQVTIKLDNEIILQGKRDPRTGLWTINLPTGDNRATLPGPKVIQHTAMSAIAAETLGESVAFLHACAGSPALSTFRDAIQNVNYTTWPELTAERVDKYLTAPAATIKGHLDQQRKNNRSTKPKAKPKASSPYQLPGKSEIPEE